MNDMTSTWEVRVGGIMTMKNVNRYTRAGKNGKELTCPKCNHTEKVYHFAWSAAGCLGCREYINKEDFLVKV